MKSLNFKESYLLGALFYAFVIPLPQKLVNIALIIWVLLSLISFNKNSLVKNKYFFLLPGLYLLYFIGLYTGEAFTFKFLEYKLSFIVFPLLFFLHGYTHNQRNKILQVFVRGLTASTVVCFAIACYNSVSIEESVIQFKPNVLEGKTFMESILYGGNYFFGKHLSFFHQTVYYALYLCSGIAILLFKPKLFSSEIRYTLLILFIVFVFLVSNKASFVALIILLVLKLFIGSGSLVKKTTSFSLLAIIVAFFVFMNPRIKESLAKVAAGELTLNKDARYGFSTRILSWNAALLLIKERPILGYGYGDTQIALNRQYKEKGYTYPLREQYNAHNLWLQSWLENGILAILILLSIFYLLLRKEWPYIKTEPLLLSFILLLLINSMFEGMFNRFSGVSFFSFLVCFIFSTSRGGKTET